jgi:coatomer protein complex subunit gamma
MPLVSTSQSGATGASTTNTPTPASTHFVSSFDQQAIYAEQLSSVADFSSFGALFKSSAKPIELTESETEYVVHCIKHTFARHVVFQFNCTNTLNDQLLEQVHMVMQPEIDGLVQLAEVPADTLEYNVPGVIYVAFEQEDPEELANGKKKKRERNHTMCTLTHSYIYSFFYQYASFHCKGL